MTSVQAKSEGAEAAKRARKESELTVRPTPLCSAGDTSTLAGAKESPSGSCNFLEGSKGDIELVLRATFDDMFELSRDRVRLSD